MEEQSKFYIVEEHEGYRKHEIHLRHFERDYILGKYEKIEPVTTPFIGENPALPKYGLIEPYNISNFFNLKILVSKVSAF